MKYGELCAENEEIRKKAREIGLENLAGQIAHAKSLGLEFSGEDFVALAHEEGLDGKSELSEEELKKVAGGVGTLTAILLAGLGMAVIGGVAGASLTSKAGW
jgi:lactobin A/cerein 7B family class IIb bacteriocin